MSRSAIVALAAGVTVAVAALILGSSIRQLQLDPSLSGQKRSQRVLDAGEGIEVFERAMATMDSDARAVDLLGLHVAFGVKGPGDVDLPTLVYDLRRGEVDASVLQGRLPDRADEVAIGPASLEKMGIEVGDEIELHVAASPDDDSQAANEGTARFEIVGAVLFPEGDFSYDSGVAMTADGARFFGGIDATAIHQVAFAWGRDFDTASADEELAAAGFTVFESSEGLVPARVTNLGQIRSLAAPVAGLALFLGLVTALYAVTTTGRLRRRETCTLRALGMRPGAVATTTEVQGLSIAMVGVAVGLPLGIAVGRQIWTLIVDRAHLIDHPVVSWGSLAWCAGATVLGIAIFAAPLAVLDARQSPAAVLHTE